MGRRLEDFAARPYRRRGPQVHCPRIHRKGRKPEAQEAGLKSHSSLISATMQLIITMQR